MITHLEGDLVHLDLSLPGVEIGVNGVRYEVLVPLFLWPEIQALAEAAPAGEGALPGIGLFIHESATANQPLPVLTGFLRRPERDFFRKFISVEGIGPSKAVKALTLSVSTIARAIEQEDRVTLTRLPGIGPRAADKVIATLRGKVTAEAALQDSAIQQQVDVAALAARTVVADAIDALTALGYQRADARRWVEEAQAADGGLLTVEALTLAVLRKLGS